METNDSQSNDRPADPAAAGPEFDSPNTAEVARRAKKSVGFQAASGIISQAIRFGAGIVLARILEPEEFGILAMAEIVKGFAREFANVGLAPSIIQNKTVDRQFLSTAFWFNLGVAGIFCAALILISPLVGNFFRNPEVGSVLRISSLNMLVMSGFTVWNALLMRELRFPIISSLRVLEAAFAAIFCVSLALLDYGVYAIAYGVLASTVLSLLIIFPYAQRQLGFWPAWTFSTESLRRLIGFGVLVRLKDSINYFAMNIEFLLAGRMLGAALLGQYRRAYSLMHLPVDIVAYRIIAPVLFPALSQIQHDVERMVSWYEKAIVSCGLLVLPGLAGMIVVAPEFITFVYGPKWMPAVAPLQILCLSGMITSISTFSGAILTAKRLVGRELIHQIIYFCIITIGIYLVLQRNDDNVLAKIALVVLGAHIFLFVANQRYVNNVFNYTWARMARSLYPVLIAVSIEYVAASALRGICLELMSLGTLPTLLLTIVAGAGAYVCSIWLFRSNVSEELTDRLLQKVRSTIASFREQSSQKTRINR